MTIIKKSEFQKFYKIACLDWQEKFRKKFESEIFSDELEFTDEYLTEMESACRPDQLIIFKQIFKSWTKKENLFNIDTYSKVCKAIKEKEITEKDFKGVDAVKLCAFARVKQLERLFNGDWVADYSKNDDKYYSYFINEKGKWRFYGWNSYSSYCLAWAGVYKNEKIATHVGKNFLEEIYIHLL